MAEWDCDVRLQAFNVARRVAFQTVITENAIAHQNHKDDPEQYPEKVELLDDAMVSIVFSLVDENDQLMFDMDDMEALKELPYSEVKAMYVQMMLLNHGTNLVAKAEAEKKD
ncbi:hypothetical protein M2341_000996 [Sphingobium sp. B7D2B]|uniref:hypothetical protein n=1 Tax=Sphingobium sp. B7D2B TaxID=2940583 RepID=UPI00222459CA|nr:hypothetical protein [Sphingobium sp. B7D2B]MCW2365549.1 hypothetical protein [Sphingobium sp. B7D2B]